MNKRQVKVFEELLNDPDFKGKEKLADRLWKNTKKPKLKKGDCYKVNLRWRLIKGNPKAEFKAKILELIDSKVIGERKYVVEIVLICEDGNETCIDIVEKKRMLQAERCEDNLNVTGCAKSNFEDMINATEMFKIDLYLLNSGVQIWL